MSWIREFQLRKVKRTMKIDLDYGVSPKTIELREKDGGEFPSAQEMTSNFISYGVSQRHKDGLSSRDRRIWARLQRRLEEAVDTGVSEIDLEAAEFEFIHDSFKDQKFPSGDAK